MTILLDGHVHIYPGFSIDYFLNAAWNNFYKASGVAELSGNTNFVLALTESKGFDVFSELRKQATSPETNISKLKDTSAFSFFKTAEPQSLIACKDDMKLVLIAGRQIISKENIELLSLFSLFKTEDKTLSLIDLAKHIADTGGLPVLPWGVGKWWGARGKAVAELIHTDRDYPLFLADNGNRPTFWPEPTILRQACAMQMPILSGSDPLPLASHVKRPGSAGILIYNQRLSKESPATDLHKMLISENKIINFGDRASSIPFIIDQLRINLRNITRKNN